MENLGAYFLTFPIKLLAIYIYNVYICGILTLIYTTMAIIDSIWLQGARKRLDNVVLYEAMGQTRSRKLRTSISNPRTQAQMSQRIKWSNLVNFYRANASWMKYAFESKKTNQSEYNAFMSRNVTASRIALTKDMAASGACVAYPYIMTQGTLPSIEWLNTETELLSNIYLTFETTIDDYANIGEFSRALIENNPAFREGDQLSFIRITQQTNSSTGYPYINVRKYEMILNTSSSAALGDYWPTELLSVKDLEKATVLTLPKENRQGGFVIILSRTTGGKTYVSSQALVPVNMEEIISNYSSTMAIRDAISSYGESEDAFLSSVTANTISAAPVVISPNYLNIISKNYSPGATTPVVGTLEGQQGTIYFSGPIPAGAAVTGRVVALQGSTISIATVTAEGNAVRFTFPQFPQEEDKKHLYKVIIRVNGTDYELTFAGTNVYTIEGLE